MLKETVGNDGLNSGWVGIPSTVSIALKPKIIQVDQRQVAGPFWIPEISVESYDFLQCNFLFSTSIVQAQI